MHPMNGWKTVLFNALVFLVGVAEMFGVALPDTFASDVNGAILAVVGAVGIGLRAVTTSPVGWKKDG